MKFDLIVHDYKGAQPDTYQLRVMEVGDAVVPIYYHPAANAIADGDIGTRIF